MSSESFIPSPFRLPSENELAEAKKPLAERIQRDPHEAGNMLFHQILIERGKATIGKIGNLEQRIESILSQVPTYAKQLSDLGAYSELMGGVAAVMLGGLIVPVELHKLGLTGPLYYLTSLWAGALIGGALTLHGMCRVQDITAENNHRAHKFGLRY